MTTFTILPSYPAQLQKKPIVHNMAFGDGYVQRIQQGLNNNPESWNLSWDDLDDVTANTIMDFFETANGKDSFNWVNPRGVNNLFICQQWSRQHDDEDKNSIKAVFQQIWGI